MRLKNFMDFASQRMAAKNFSHEIFKFIKDAWRGWKLDNETSKFVFEQKTVKYLTLKNF